MFKPKHDKFSNKHKGGGNFGGFKPGREKGNRGFSGGWDREERAVFEAVCDQCGRPCVVPFKPTGSRPVLCKQCFKGESDSGPKRFGGKDRGRPSFRKEDRGFRKGGDFRQSGERQPDLKGLERQVHDISRKLDLLLEALTPPEAEKKKKAGGKKKKEVMAEENPVDETDLDDDPADDYEDDDFDDDFDDDEELGGDDFDADEDGDGEEKEDDEDQ